MANKPSNFDIIAELVKETSGQRNIISLPRIYLKIAGDVVVGLFLSQCVWYSDKGGSHDGWFYKSNKEWQEEIGLSYAQVKRAAAKLEEMGILHIKLKKAGGAPTTHYYVDMDRLTKLIFDFLEIRQNGGVENQESLKSDFQESSKSITALTQSSTGTALKEPPTFDDFQEAEPNDLSHATDNHQRCIDKGCGGNGTDPTQEIATHLFWGFERAPSDLPSGKDWKKWQKGGERLLRRLPRALELCEVIQRIDSWFADVDSKDAFWHDNPLHDTALDIIARFIKNGGQHARNDQRRTRRGVPAYSVADPAAFHDQSQDDAGT